MKEPFVCASSDLDGLQVDSLGDMFRLLPIDSGLTTGLLGCSMAHEVMSVWSQANTFNSSIVLPACLDYRYACLVACGCWQTDLSVVVSRDKRRSRLHPSLPPRDLENSYLSSLDQRSAQIVYDHDDSSEEMFRQDRSRKYGCLSSFSPHHLMRALQVDRFLSVSGSIEPVSFATLRLLFPHAPEEELRGLLRNESFDIPS